MARYAISLVVSLLPEWSAGQANTGEISGVVRDHRGVIPGATVTVHHIESGIPTERVSE